MHDEQAGVEVPQGAWCRGCGSEDLWAHEQGVISLSRAQALLEIREGWDSKYWLDRSYDRPQCII